MHDVPLRVGIDAGGTRTVAVLGAQPGTVLGRGEAGPGNPHAVGFALAAQHAADAVRSALSEADLPHTRLSTLAHVAVGMAGGGLESDRLKARSLLAGRLGLDPKRLTVVQDVALLLPSAGLSWGVALVAGTGSSAYGVSTDSRIAIAGGWGFLLGDDGSAFWVGREALRIVARTDDGLDPETALTPALVGALQVSSPRGLIPAIYQSREARGTIARLAPRVADCAASGDAAAQSILCRAAEALADLVLAVQKRLDLPSSAPVVCSGGLFRAGPFLLDALGSALASRGLGPARQLEREPALGALVLAFGGRQSASGPPDQV